MSCRAETAVRYWTLSMGTISSLLMKYGRGKTRPPKAFLTDYENAEWRVVNEENWLDFVL